MNVGERILIRLKVVAISQSELARRVGMSQSAMNNLIAGRSRSSTHLHKIARHLLTTPAYLVGETDDPDEGAPPPEPAPPPRVMLEVVLPPAPLLTTMFEAILSGVEEGTPHRELAQLLAQNLSIGLGRLATLPPVAPNRPRSSQPTSEAHPEDRAMHDHGVRS